MPPCPACGEPLFAWTQVAAGDPQDAARVLDRCEDCGLVLAREADAGGAAAALDRDELPNAASIQAGIGADSWSALRPDGEPVVLTPKSLELLAARNGRELAGISYGAGPGMAVMLATILNLLTFNRDFPRRVVGRELGPRNARHGWPGFLIDALVTAFTAIPVAILAVLLEGAAILAHRGGVMRPELRRSVRARD